MYKNLKSHTPIIFHSSTDECLTDICGLHYRDKNENELDDPDAIYHEHGAEPFNGRCRSKSKQKRNPGFCNEHDCPLSYLADYSTIKELDEELYNSLKDFDSYYESEIKSGVKEEDIRPNTWDPWVIQYRELNKNVKNN